MAFTATTYMRNFHVGAPLEWVVGFLFGLFIISFAVDLYPAVHAENGAFFAPKDVGRGSESTDVEMARRASELSRDSDDMREVRGVATVAFKL